jgi:MFS family permease
VTPELARADRAEAVRNAARSWRRAGVIDGAALPAIEQRYPDDRSRVGPVFRVLLFLFTLLAGNALFGFIATANPGGGVLAGLALVTGIVLAAVTDHLVRELRRRQGGIEAATSFMAIGYLLGAVAWWVSESDYSLSSTVPILCVAGAVLCAAAAWRWGYPLYAAAAAAALLVALARLPLGRLGWIVLPLAAAPVLLRLSTSPRLPPAHRDSCTAILFVALAGLYAAVHFGSWKAQAIEELGERHPQAPAEGDLWWWLALVATALVPAVFLALGLRGRRYPLLLLGAGATVVSLVTLRWYVHLAPLWVVLVVSGTLLAAVVFALRRYLESGPEGERHGFTAAPLFQDPARLRLLEAGAAVLTLAPEARTIHEEPKFEGGGGQFGGGGAGGGF